MAKVLIIDDDQTMCTMLLNLVCRMGHEAVCHNSAASGLQAALSAPYDVVFLDVQMPDGNGLDILSDIRATPSCPEVIIMTGFGNADGAEIAIKSGAWDYIQKSDSLQKIILPLQRVLQYRESLRNGRRTARALKLTGIVGNSAPMLATYDWVAQVSATEGNVLLTGETGTGKELFARAIHDNSSRCDSNFVVVDCAALPETLVESILFGHEKGAFTGADHPRQGLVAQAHGGTLFLDEIGELPLNVQKIFLRVLQERRYRPVGGKQECTSDFRLIAATNRDLELLVENGGFRKDLMFRLRALNITLPPLRKHTEDIKALVSQHIGRICERLKIGIKGTSPDFLELLTRYAWPGNVRELINTLEWAISSAGDEDMLFSRHLPDYIRIQAAQASLADEVPSGPERKVKAADIALLPSFKTYRKAAAERVEKEYLEKLTSATRGDVQAACRISRLSRSRYYQLIKLHQVSTLQQAQA
jgi:two-component system NtrC family response regulator